MNTARKGALLGRALRLASGAVALLALVVIIAWHAHWAAALQFSPRFPPMAYNTAICLLLCGGGVIAVTTRWHRFAFILGAVSALIGVLTTLEYYSTVRLGIDEIFVRDYLSVAGSPPGRMSPLSANCLILLGLGVAMGAARRYRFSLVVAAALGCIVAVISSGMLLGFLVGIQAADGWGAYTSMPPQTGASFVILSLTLLVWAWETAGRRNVSLSGWLPIVASVTLMAMIAFISFVSLTQMRSAIDWRQHTYNVLLKAHTLLEGLADIERGTLRAMPSDAPGIPGKSASGLQQAPHIIVELEALTSDNPRQLPRLREVAANLAGPALTRDALGAIDRARSVLQSFSDEERVLLRERDTIARANVNNTMRLLVTGSVLAPALLVLAHLIAGAEMNRRRRTEAELNVVSSLQTAILNAADYGIIATSVDGIVTSFNSTAERWLGYLRADVIGKPATAKWHEARELQRRSVALSAELGQAVTPGFETLVAKARRGHRDEAEWCLVRRDGSQFPAWISVTAVHDVHGNAVGYVQVISDITDRKQHEAELRVAEERFRRAFDDAPIGMALVGVSGRLLKVNRSLCDAIGYEETELLTMDLHSITHADDLPAELELIQRVLAGELPSFQLEKRYLHKDGSVTPVNLTLSLVRDADQNPLYFVKQIQNIAERMEIDRLKGEFISTVSHELRTPLTSIRGSLGLIDAGVLGKLPQKAEAMVKIAYQNCERLVHIINDILDLEKSNSGGLDLRIERIPVAPFLQQALAANQSYGAKYGVRFVLESAPAAVEILADPYRLMQVMANLLSNAAKFSPRGSTVVVRAGERGAQVRVEVEDRGIGIPPEFQGHIFEKFAQAESSGARRFEGTGLGLSITRQLLKAMDGTIGFTTAPGAGTNFHFELPRADRRTDAGPDHLNAAADSERPPWAMPADWEPPQLQEGGATLPRVLHVEDDADLSNVLKTALAGRVDVVNAATLAAARMLLRDEVFVAMVLDPVLPDGNGLTLLDQSPLLGEPPMPIVIFSASEVPRDIQARVSAVLVKSRLSEAYIVQTILALVSRSGPS
jgi:PAS domain S-box-containing protein